MVAIRSWSYSRLHSEDVWDWESGDIEASDWPIATEEAIVTYENGGRRIIVRGVFHTPVTADVLPRRVTVTDGDLRIELEQGREDTDGAVPDVGVHNPFEIVVEFDGQIDASALPQRTIVAYYRNGTVFFRTTVDR